VRVTSGNAPNGGLNPQLLTAAGSTLYFSANDGTHAAQLWSASGSTATMLTSANVSGGGVNPQELTAAGSTLYFSGNDGTHNRQLWSSNGTSSGTAMLADINGTSNAVLSDLTNVAGTLYFAAYTPASGYQVWQSDGTSSGTVKDTSLSTGSSNVPANFAGMSSSLYFTAPGATMWQWQPGTGSTSITRTITRPNPASIAYGTTLSSTQLDSTASVDGTTLKAGTDTVSVTFTPTDSTDDSHASPTPAIVVTQANPAITWANPASIVYGTALSSTQLDATASASGKRGRS
jgi:ELWxxDGT repeat protein